MPASQDSSPLPELFDFKVSVKVTKSGEQVYIVTPKSTLWPNQASVSVSFLDGTDAQKSLVKAAFAEYATYADTNVVYVDDGSTDANIRVSFEGDKVWSAVGTQSLQIEETATISLGSISKTDPTDSDLAVALHHVGRALGLADDQVNVGGDGFTEAAVSSSASGSAEEKQHAAPKTQLTDADKAWLTLHYPGRVATEWTTLHALDVLDVPLDVGSKILSSELSGQRAHYASYIFSKSSKAEGGKNDALTSVSSQFVSTANAKVQIGGYFGEALEGEGPGPVETQADIEVQNIIGNCYGKPWFHRTIANITKSDLKQRGIAVKEEPEGAQNGLVFANGVETQQGIFDFGNIVPQIARKIIFGSGIQAQAGISADAGYYPGQPLSPELQQGIFDVFTKVIKNPIFTEVVKKAVQAI